MSGVFDFGSHADENLGDVGTDRPGVFADLGVIQGNVTPTEDFKSFGLDRFTNQVAAISLDFRRHEHHANAIFSGAGQVDTQGRGLALEQLGWGLDQHAGPVACLGVTPGGATVAKVTQHLHTFVYNLVCLLAFDVGDDAHAASIVFLLRRVQSFLSQFF